MALGRNTTQEQTTTSAAILLAMHARLQHQEEIPILLSTASSKAYSPEFMLCFASLISTM